MNDKLFQQVQDKYIYGWWAFMSSPVAEPLPYKEANAIGHKAGLKAVCDFLEGEFKRDDSQTKLV